MSKYEYCLMEFNESRRESFDFSKDHVQKELIEELNKKGADGWHVVSNLGRAVGGLQQAGWHDEHFTQHFLLERFI